MEYVKSIVALAEKANKMSESMYLFWFELNGIPGDGDDEGSHAGQMLPFISKALQQYPTSVELWVRSLIVKAKVYGKG